MSFDLITVQKVSFYNVYKSELLLRAVCCSFCQFLCQFAYSEFALLVNGQFLMNLYSLFTIDNSLIHVYTFIPVLIFALLALEFSSISLSSGMIALLLSNSNTFL